MTSLTSSPISSLTGTLNLPGDKSISHRALMLSSQVLGTTTIAGLLEGEDVLSTAEALRCLGVTITKTGNQWQVQGVGVGGLHEPACVLDMGNSGTSARLLMGLLTPYPYTSFFTGDDSLRSRPMRRVIEPLTQIGAEFAARTQNRLPLALTGTATPMPITYSLPVPSAQVKSAILLAGLNTPGITTVIEAQATRDHTENMLESLGFAINREQREDGSVVISIAGHQELPFADRRIEVPVDPSSAAFLIVAALITQNSEITIPNICINPLRAGLFVTLKEMGAQLEYHNERMVAGEKVADIIAKSSKLKAVNVPASRAPSMIDEYPILAVACAFAEGESIMEGLSELRVKESDRLNAIVQGLTTCGVDARVEGDTLFVKGGTVSGNTTITTNHDHRIAMSFLIMGMAAQKPVSIDANDSIATSFPGFTDLCNQAGAKINGKADKPAGPYIIAIDGPAASGKGTLARRLAEHLGIAYLDTGSLYRAVGMKLAYAGKDPNDKQAAIEAAQSITPQDLANPRLRQEHIGKAASIISAMPEIREILLEFQRNFARTGKGAVLDGRDIGTVVCPNANLKLFVTASMEARAKRRHREISGQGVEVVYDSVLEDLKERDERDSQRTIAPLKPAEDAIIIDTSTMDANSVFEKARSLVNKKLGVSAKL